MSANNESRAWDWRDDADDLVVPEQPAIAVYINPADDGKALSDIEALIAEEGGSAA